MVNINRTVILTLSLDYQISESLGKMSANKGFKMQT